MNGFINYIRFFVICLIWVSPFKSNAQDNSSIDSLITEFRNSTELTKKEIYDKAAGTIFQLDTTMQHFWLDSLVELTSKTQNYYYYQSLIFNSGWGALNRRIAILNKAFEVSKEWDKKDYPAFAAELKSDAYKQFYMYDSAMVSILIAKKYFELAHHNDGLVAVMHKIADFHFDAAYYNKAEEYYNRILELKGNIGAWNEWRHVVINNDLGLIEERRGNYDKALEYFNGSLNIIKNKPYAQNSNDTVRLGYCFLKIAEMYLMKNDITKANVFYEKSLKITEEKDESRKLDLYILKTKIDYMKGDYNSALRYLNRAENLNKKIKDIFVRKDIYLYFSLIYSKQKKFEKSNQFYHAYTALEDSTVKIKENTRYMQIFAENNYNNYQNEIEKINRERNYLIGILILFGIASSIIFGLFLKKRKSDLQIIKKSVELINAEKQHNGIASKDERLFDQNDEGEELADKKLAKAFEELIKNEKLYLKSDLNTTEIVEKLNTNRSYLSKAINKNYHVNFTTFINELRIKEAVKLFSQKEHEKYTVETISQKVGFNNRTTFIKAFRNYTGVTPSFFIKNIDDIAGSNLQ